MSDQPALAIEDLWVRYATAAGPVHAVNGLSLRVAAGEVLALVGESGCGKSATALAVLGLSPPGASVRGRIELSGQDLLGLTSRQLRAARGQRVAMVFQDPMTSLNPAFTIGWQVAEALRRRQRIGRRAARRRAAEALRQVGIADPERRLGDYPHQLSGGMRQRVMIAMALACEPAVLVADEPTTALDVTIQAQMLEILRDARDRLGLAVLLITHDLAVVADIADRVAVMYAGALVESAGAAELLAAPRHPYTIGLLGAVPALADPAAPADPDRRLAEIPGTTPVLRAAPDNCSFADRCGRVTPECRQAVPRPRELADGSSPAPHWAACLHPGTR